MNALRQRLVTLTKRCFVVRAGARTSQSRHVAQHDTSRTHNLQHEGACHYDACGLYICTRVSEAGSPVLLTRVSEAGRQVTSTVNTC